jgi:sensor histidine kinase YesM
MECEMIRWRIFFVLISCILIWCNEWSKINCNYQIHLRNAHFDWDSLSIDERISMKQKDEEALPFSFFHTHSDFNWMYDQSLSFWTTMKWVIPCLFTLLFALVEWMMLPFCFPQLSIQRSWIFYYYSVLMLLVVFSFFVSQFIASEAIFALTRKIWMILQSPSLFVLFFVYNLMRNDSNHQRDRAVS